MSEALEALAFDAVFAAAGDEAAAPVSAPARARATAAARALGRLSRRRYEAVFARFLQELESRLRIDTPTARAEVSELAGALKYMYLPVRKQASACLRRN